MKITWIPTIICLLHASWTSPVNGGGENFCTNSQCKAARIDLSVTLTGESVELQWTSPIRPMFGYCVFYECNSDENVNYCSDGREKCIRRFSKHQRLLYSYAYLNIPHNTTTCWFWVVTKGARNDCSKVVHSNASSPTEGPSSSILLLPSTTENLLPSTATPSVISSMITSSKSVSPISSLTTSSQSLSTALSQPPSKTVLLSVSTTVLLASSGSAVLSSTTVPSVSLTVSPSTSTAIESSTIPSSTSTVSSSIPIESSTTVPLKSSVSSTPSKSSIPPLESLSSSSPYKRKTSIYLLVLLAFLSVAVLAVLLISIMLLVYWKKDKLRKFDDLTKNKIEEYCDYDDDIAKDNNSDLEYVEPDDKDCDVYTINEDNLYMLEQISHKQEEIIQRTSLVSHCSDSDVDSGIPSHYYGSNNGSAGHCSSLNDIIDCGSPASSDEDSI